MRIKLVFCLVLVLNIAISSEGSRSRVSVIRSSNITNLDRGNWGPAEYCGSGHYANGFRSKVQKYCGEDCDNTSMNGIQLVCSDENIISSSVGQWGAWAPNFSRCDPGQKLTGFSVKLQSDQGREDETATNAIEMRCSDGKTLTSLEGDFGEWIKSVSGGESDIWFNCPNNLSIFGLRTQVQPPQRGDDTALNNFEFFCRQ
jgi:hypothetical protein